jgi:hypothetical protein
MHHWKTFGCVVAASFAVFALGGCGKADAGVQTAKAAAVAPAVTVSDAHPTADAEADNGPGCAESCLHGARSAPAK